MCSAQAFASYSLFRYIFCYCLRTPAQVFQAAIECSHSLTICVIYVLMSLITAGLQPLMSAESTQSIAADSWARLPCVRRQINATQCVRQHSQTTHGVCLDKRWCQASRRLYWLLLSSVTIIPSMHMHPWHRCSLTPISAELRVQIGPFDVQFGPQDRSACLSQFGPWSFRSLVTLVLKKGPKWLRTEVIIPRHDE